MNLKPHEKVIIGNSVIENGQKSASFVIHNKATILREKDIMTEEKANTPAKRIYFVVQLMYMAGGIEESKEHHSTFFVLTNQFLKACPTPEAVVLISEMGMNVLNENFYAALKCCKDLMEYEKGILDGDTTGMDE
ncbi:MAG: flagellar biosynthesis repressor FlbT [Rhodospirillaceae bacterium]|nr:flagellar biosynthesis repressor FlbT [Rhodospirillaceae bacterium]